MIATSFSIHTHTHPFAYLRSLPHTRKHNVCTDNQWLTFQSKFSSISDHRIRVANENCANKCNSWHKCLYVCACVSYTHTQQHIPSYSCHIHSIWWACMAFMWLANNASMYCLWLLEEEEEERLYLSDMLHCIPKLSHFTCRHIHIISSVLLQLRLYVYIHA